MRVVAGRRLAGILGIVLGLGSACSTRPEFLPLFELAEDEVVFVLWLDPAGAWSVRGPVGADVWDSAFRRLELPEGSEVFLAPISIGELHDFTTILDETRLAELHIEASPESCSTGRREGRFERYPLEIVVPTLLIASDGLWVERATPSGLALALPIDRDQCWPGPSPVLRPFGDELLMMRPGVMVGRDPIRAEDDHGFLGEAHPLGPDHLITASFSGLKVFERDQTWSNDPKHLLGLDALPNVPNEHPYVFRGVVVGPRSVAGEHVLRFGYIRSNVTNTGIGGGVMSVTWNEVSGFGRPQSALEAPDLALFEITLDGEDTWISVGDEGVILSGDFESTTASRHQIPGAGSLRRAMRSKVSDEPHVIVDTTLNLFFGDLEAARWRPELSATIFSGINGATLRDTADGPEVYLAPFSSGLTRRGTDGARGILDFEVPPEAAHCATGQGECGPRALSGLPVDLDFSPHGTLVLSLESCGLLLEVNLEKSCSRALPVPYLDPADRERTRLRYAHFDGERLLLTGSEGLIAEAYWTGAR